MNERENYSQGNIHSQGSIVTITLLEAKVEIAIVLIITQVHHEVLAVVVGNDSTFINLILNQADDATIDRPLDVEIDGTVLGLFSNNHNIEIAVFAENLGISINGQEQTRIHLGHARMLVNSLLLYPYSTPKRLEPRQSLETKLQVKNTENPVPTNLGLGKDIRCDSDIDDVDSTRAGSTLANLIVSF